MRASEASMRLRESLMESGLRPNAVCDHGRQRQGGVTKASSNQGQRRLLPGQRKTLMRTREFSDPSSKNL